MFSLKTILFAATAALAGIASAAPASYGTGSALAARCECDSIPSVLAYVNVQLDGILADVRKYSLPEYLRFAY